MKLNLITDDKEQELILAYLNEHTNEELEKKINNGTPFEKDGKTLINKKTLDGFMIYASAEAKKLAEKGKQYACIEDKTVYGWAIHYFYEDDIEDTLYNPDGTEYKPKVAAVPTQKPPISHVKPQNENTQFSFFDALQNDNSDNETDEEPTEEDLEEAVDELIKEENQLSEKSKGNAIFTF